MDHISTNGNYVLDIVLIHFRDSGFWRMFYFILVDRLLKNHLKAIEDMLGQFYLVLSIVLWHSP